MSGPSEGHPQTDERHPETSEGSAQPDVATLPPLDPVIHAQARLRVVTVLANVAGGEHLAFPSVQELLDMTAGNLSTHLRKLEDAGYVEVVKAHKGRTPVTWVALTSKGRRAHEAYIESLRVYLDGASGNGAGGTA